MDINNVSIDEDTVPLEALFYSPINDVISMEELQEMTILKAPMTSEIIDMEIPTDEQLLEQLFPEGASLPDLIPDFDLDLGGSYEEEWLWPDGSIRPTKPPLVADEKTSEEIAEKFDWGDLPSSLSPWNYDPEKAPGMNINNWITSNTTGDWFTVQQEVGEETEEEEEEF